MLRLFFDVASNHPLFTTSPSQFCVGMRLCVVWVWVCVGVVDTALSDEAFGMPMYKITIVASASCCKFSIVAGR